MKTPSPRREETSDRIIAAAGAVFAERGFRGTTIRQITARAGVNLAAVHYHFRDKEELYVRVLREAKRHVAWIAIEDLPGSPEEKLRGFIDRFVRYLLDPERPAWHGRVIAMELANPTPALGVVIREVTAPLYREVRALIRVIVDAKATTAELDLLTLSIFGQCIFHVSARPIVEQLASDLERTSNRTDRIAAHISDFSVAALRGFVRRPQPERAARSNSLALR